MSAWIPKILVPAKTAKDWKAFLGDPKRHWRTGYSAKALAYCWQTAQDFPASVRRVLANPDAGGFAELTMLMALPEWRVPLPPTTRRPSQVDLFAIARAGADLVTIAVEGKVAETFGRKVSEWQADSRSDGKAERLRYLCGELGLPEGTVGELRYQLLHRTAVALIEARRFNASEAVMLVHSFSGVDAGFDDFARFASRLGATPKVDGVTSAGQRNGTHLHLAWVRGEQEYLRV